MIRPPAALAALALLCSCSQYKLTRLQTIDAAAAVPPFVAMEAAQMIPEGSDWPCYGTPYAYFETADMGNGGLSSMVRRSVKLGVPQPDFMFYRSTGSVYAGQTSTYIGFGITTSSAVYKQFQKVYLMRRTPTRPGIKSSEGMVVELTPQARESGIQEGDRLLSLDGHSTEMSDGAQYSAWQAYALTVQPGQEVEAVWIRPGEGRMSGTLKMAENDPVRPMEQNLYRSSKESRGTLGSV